MPPTTSRVDSLVVRTLYRVLLREVRRFSKPIRLTLGVDAHKWGSGALLPARRTPCEIQAILFPGIDFQSAGLGNATSIDSLNVQTLVCRAFRAPASSAGLRRPLDAGLAHLATLNRLRAYADCNTVTVTHNGSAAIETDVTTQEIQVPGVADGGVNDTHLFAYRVIITNVGTVPVVVLGRQWRFVDARGGITEVPRMSPGVVGQQPQLEPGMAFEYVSGTTLATPTGTVSGSFQVIEAALTQGLRWHPRSRDQVSPAERHQEWSAAPIFDARVAVTNLLAHSACTASRARGLRGEVTSPGDSALNSEPTRVPGGS